MVAYEFYGDSSILGLKFDSGREVFFDLADLSRVADWSDAQLAELGDPQMQVYLDRDSVRDLFGANGCLEECPLEKEVE